MQRIIPRKLNGFNDVESIVFIIIGILLILRFSNELHRPIINTIKPNLKIFSYINYDENTS